MSNTIFGFPAKTRNFTLSGGSYLSLYPRNNLLDVNDLRAVARTSDALVTSTVIKGTCPTAQSIGIVALPSNNMDLSATIRTRLFSDVAWTTSLKDTTAITPWPGGEIIDNDWIFWDGNNYNVKSFQIDIVNTGNTDGFLEFGCLELATAVEAPFQFDVGGQRGRELRTTKSETPGGREIFDRRNSRRIMNLSFDSEDDDLYDLYQELIRQNDLDVPFIVIPHPGDPNNWTQTAMFCRIADQNPTIQYSQSLMNKVSLKLRQAIAG